MNDKSNLKSQEKPLKLNLEDFLIYRMVPIRKEIR